MANRRRGPTGQEHIWCRWVGAVLQAPEMDRPHPQWPGWDSVCLVMQVTPGQSRTLTTPGGKGGWSRGRAGPGSEGAARSVSGRGGRLPHPAPEQGQHEAERAPAAQRAQGRGGGPRPALWNGKVTICPVLQWLTSCHRVSSAGGLLGRHPPKRWVLGSTAHLASKPKWSGPPPTPTGWDTRRTDRNH